MSQKHSSNELKSFQLKNQTYFHPPTHDTSSSLKAPEDLFVILRSFHFLFFFLWTLVKKKYLSKEKKKTFLLRQFVIQ